MNNLTMNCCPHHELHEECRSAEHARCTRKYEAFGHRNVCGCTCHEVTEDKR